ncbi:polyphosphate polymerase domain-containing protein [Candidatus Pelagibacter sp.]|nr:polyphosphate polymerase domain-containing protein [Candidatus Pelagibacter sp.]
MSFRIEEKILIGKNQVIEFKKIYQKKFLKKLYQPRIIRSLYFDNSNNDMYKDSVEGTLPRKKIRVRNYPGVSENEFYLEKKVSSVEGRFKQKEKINNLDFEKMKKYGVYDDNYGCCKPLIYVEYNRHYYVLGKTRLTHDINIKYYLYQSKIIKYDENEIFEIKTDFNTNLDELHSVFPMNRSRFSKYCSALEKFSKQI